MASDNENGCERVTLKLRRDEADALLKTFIQ